MDILIIGGGGREHALAWKAAQSPLADTVYVAPGNAGTAREPGVTNVPIGAGDVPALLDFARERGIGLTIVGPEAPLVAGIVDAFAEAGLRCFGPRRAAAQLEGSKAWAKAFIDRHGIPTASHRVFGDADEARAWVRARGAPVVVKADGLAAGKGVVIARSVAEAEAAIADMLEADAFGAAGRRIVVEDFLEGEEASFIVMCDGSHILPMASSQDHKARDDGDVGPNTGGMGAYSPAPVVTPEVHARIMREVIEPAVQGLATEGEPYTGFLYAGVMVGPDGTPRVLEFNCRLGDPETQPILMRLRSDLVALCLAALDGTLGTAADWDPGCAVGVVLAAAGYPGNYPGGDVIEGLEDAAAIAGTKVFHAGTAERDGHIVTAGGRVLCVCGVGDTVSAAQRTAYQAVDRIGWRGMQHRTDIGHRAIARESGR